MQLKVLERPLLYKMGALVSPEQDEVANNIASLEPVLDF